MDSVEQWFRHHYPFVCQVIFRYVRNRTTTEDIAQDIFAELWAKREHLHIHTSVPAYLRRMAISRALNYIRDSKKYTWDDLDPATDHEQGTTSQEAEIIQKMEGDELRQELEKAIEALPEKCRLVFLLSRRDEMSYSEVAEHLQISIKTVENQIGKALKLLRQAVSGYRG